MPRYEADPSKVTATFEVLEKGDYEFAFGEPKAFLRTGDKGDNYGVRYPVKVAEGPFTGKRQIVTCYIHTDDALAFSKQTLMAALGFDVNSEGEKAFNAKYAGSDWSIDTDTGACGDVWREVIGKHAVATADVGANPKDGTPTQQFKKWRKVS